MTQQAEIDERPAWPGEPDELADLPTAPVDEVLALARASSSVRGLPRPEGLPLEGWYSVQQRAGFRYLYYRWHNDAGQVQTRSLGRL